MALFLPQSKIQIFKMSSTKSPTSSKGPSSKSVPQGTFQGDKMFQMHQKSPATTQSPEKTMKQLTQIFNPPGAGGSLMAKQAALYSKGKAT